MAAKRACQRGPGFSSRMLNKVNDRAESVGGDAVSLGLLQLSQAAHVSQSPPTECEGDEGLDSCRDRIWVDGSSELCREVGEGVVGGLGLAGRRAGASG